MDQKESRRLRSGLTTVEMLLVVAVLGLVAGLAVPRFGGQLLPRETVHTSAQQIVAQLHLARRLAITEHVEHQVRFVPHFPPFTSYLIERHAPGGGWEIVRGPQELPESLVCTGWPTHRFTPLGSASSSSWLMLQQDETTRKVRVLAATGRVWAED